PRPGLFPSGDGGRRRALPPGRGSSVPVAASQARTSSASMTGQLAKRWFSVTPPVYTVLPSREKTAAVARCRYALNERRGLPPATSQRHTLPSKPAETRILPSGEKATLAA